MDDERARFDHGVNHARFRGQPDGHYESYFVRANHPERPLAFWIRYTIFSPKKHPENALGELWAAFFDGETGRHVVGKREHDLEECRFATSSFDVGIGEARLDQRSVHGAIERAAGSLSWQLEYDAHAAPLRLLPLKRYDAGFPAAKSVVSQPMARFRGRLGVGAVTIPVHDWIGSQNHNWGRRHTDLYAWGQVAGFDTHPESFLEVATARLRLGPLWTPPITPLVLRHRDKEHALTNLATAVRARGRFEYFNWDFASRNADVEIRGRISAPREAFVGLNYYNPPGGSKHCLNTKLAGCTVHLTDRTSGMTEVLQTGHRTAFELLTDDRSHGIPVGA